jgi:hypothetical protein
MKQRDIWLIKYLVSKRQWQVLKRWLRCAKNLSDTKEKVVYICKPEIGGTLSDEEERLSRIS